MVNPTEAVGSASLEMVKTGLDKAVRQHFPALKGTSGGLLYVVQHLLGSGGRPQEVLAVGSPGDFSLV